MNAASFPFAASFGRRAADFFRQQAPAAQQTQQQAPPQQQRKNPPASKRAIRQLPTVIVTPEDLVDPNNRECCICLEENHLRSRMMRLPCAHIFHPHCIVDWLCKSNTCPVCRYELATDHVEYEVLRKEKMRHRKPRFALYELQRMPIRDLLQLGERLRVDTSGCMEKQEMISLLCIHVDIIAAPQPVEYPLSLLRAMGIGELKRCMADAGVFFDPVDVVEKEDMVQIFIASGRLVILQEEENSSNDAHDDDDDRKPESTSPLVAVTAAAAAKDNDASDDDTVVSRKRACPTENGHCAHQHTGAPIVTTVDEDSDDDDNVVEHEPDQLPQSNPLMEEVSIPPNNERVASVSRESSRNVTENVSSQAEEDNDDDEIMVEQQSNDSSIEDVDQVVQNAHEEEGGINQPLGSSTENRTTIDEDVEMTDAEETDVLDDVETEYPRLVGRHASTGSEDFLVDDYASTSSSRAAAEDSRFQERSISDLQALARQMRIDITDCIERRDIIARLMSASGRSSNPRPEPNDFCRWSVSELRALAREVDVDLSNCSDRDTMIAMLLEEANERPRVADYLSALMPLARLTVPQLRAVGREWQVNLYDCIEKEEMIHRLVIAAGGPSSS